MLFSKLSTIVIPSLFTSLIQAYPQASSPASTLPQAQEIYHFPQGTWVENLALRSNGGIIATLFLSPTISYLDPSNLSAPPKTIANFSASATSTLGIAEVEPDIFYVVTNVVNLSSGIAAFTDPVKGKGQVWKLDMTKYDECAEAPVELVGGLPESLFSNGLTYIPGSGVVLVADSLAQVVFSLDVETKQARVAINNTATVAAGQAPANFAANGVRYRDGYVYFTNTGGRLYARTPVDEKTGVATGEPEVLASGLVHPDDFVLAAEGNGAYLVDGDTANLNFTAGNGESKPVCGGILGATAVQYGTTEKDGKTFYISSAGNETEYFIDPTTASGGSISKCVLP